jgi:diadenosine tetraphosphate (Ap4A) HIT family hydrolase
MDRLADEPCVFCVSAGGDRVWADQRCRVVLTDEPYAGFCRVIWNTHVREMTDLDVSERSHLMNVVFAVETVLRTLLQPHKMNLASLGNQTPHVHWHVIPRFVDDSHFPQPVWARAQRVGVMRSPAPDFFAALAAGVAQALKES